MLAAAVLASCGTEHAASDGAAFRATARRLYAALEQPSCAPPARFDRRKLLAEQFAAVGRLEAELGTSAAWSQLALARDDARYAIEHERSCWSDPSREWGVRHVEMTKTEVAAAVPELRSQAASLPALPTGNGAPARAAEFRYLARQLAGSVHLPCQMADTLSNEELLRGSIDKVERLRDDLAGTPFAIHFAIAEADAAYEASQTIVECAPPSEDGPQRLRAQIAGEVARQIAAIRAIVGGAS